MKIKQHIKDNKKTYLVGVGCLITGAGVTYYLIMRDPKILIAAAQIKQVGVLNKATQTVEVYIEALGDPGNIIQDLTTGITYASQNQAAKELGLHRSALTRHLNGTLPNVNGHIFKKIAKAAVPPLEEVA
jgi:hypothetical protein